MSRPRVKKTPKKCADFTHFTNLHRLSARFQCFPTDVCAILLTTMCFSLFVTFFKMKYAHFFKKKSLFFT